MGDRHKQSNWARRLKEIEREKEMIRSQVSSMMKDVAAVPEAETIWRDYREKQAAQAKDRRGPSRSIHESAGAFDVLETQTDESPEGELAVDFAPGPGGLETKHVVMPRLQRTDLLRPSIGDNRAPQLTQPEHDRFRNYFGTTSLQRVREKRREHGRHRARAIFMIMMVVVLSFILFKMVT